MVKMTSELDTAVEALREAMANTEAVRRYEVKLAASNAAKWDGYFDYEVFIRRAGRLYGDDVRVIVGGRRH